MQEPQFLRSTYYDMRLYLCTKIMAPTYLSTYLTILIYIPSDSLCWNLSIDTPIPYAGASIDRVSMYLEMDTVVLLAVWPVSVSYRYWRVGISVGIFSWRELLKIWRESPSFS
jgi:hypothetical protein